MDTYWSDPAVSGLLALLRGAARGRGKVLLVLDWMSDSDDTVSLEMERVAAGTPSWSGGGGGGGSMEEVIDALIKFEDVPKSDDDDE